MVLTCISFFNELCFILMRGGDIHDRTSFEILCNASMKIMDSRQLYLTTKET